MSARGQVAEGSDTYNLTVIKKLTSVSNKFHVFTDFLILLEIFSRDSWILT